MVAKQATKKAKRAKMRSTSAPASFGPVSRINTAPVSVGNSVRGSKPSVSQFPGGARVVGRDFGVALSGTVAAVTGFEIIGAMPITPCCLPASILRNFCQMYMKFKINKVVAHYITSSPTSQAGDVLFYYERDANSPMIDYSNSSFLPFVLSDVNTVIGPQWTNHSALINASPDWKSTLYGNQQDLNEDKAGTLFFFSKTNAANSPGYLLIDYDISFKEQTVNPRAGTLPVARAQSSFICWNDPAVARNAGDAFNPTGFTTGKKIDGSTSALPSGGAAGDIYKAVLQITASVPANSAWVNCTTANLMRYSDNTLITLDDGFTCYAHYDGTSMTLYPTLENAISKTLPLEVGVTATITYFICAELMLVRNVDSLTQASY